MRPEPDNRDAVEAIQAYYSPSIRHAERAAIEYAQLGVKSLITLNAGIAIAFPTIAELLLESVSMNRILLPTSVALAGLVLALLTAWIVYLNHGWEAASEHCKMELAILKSDEYFDQKTFHQFRNLRHENKHFWETHSKKYEERRDLSFKIANVTGFLSGILLVVSVVVFAVLLH
jgi:hypothetical protein